MMQMHQARVVRLDETLGQMKFSGFDNRLQTAVAIQLGEDVVYVVSNRGCADFEYGGNLPRGVAFGELRQDFFFPLREHG